MKTIARLFALAAVLAAAALAQSSDTTAGLSGELWDAVEISRARPTGAPLLRAVDFVSVFDQGIVDAFSKAWQRSMNGTLPVEGVVLIVRQADGSYAGRDMGATNEYKQFTFRWHPATVAVVHTHPNSVDAEPHRLDREVARKYRVPIFTITNRGMYVFDPIDNKTHRVLNGLDWLDATKFSKPILSRR